MATKTFYLTATTGDGWRTLSETVQAAVTNADGWVTGTGATLHSEYQVGVERATFSGTTVPDGTLDTTLKDAFRAGPITGDFASGNWVFTFVVRAVTSAGSQNGRVRFRVIKAAADGSSPTEITAAQQQGSLVGVMSSTTIDYISTLTLNPGAITLVNQYLFIQLAWERTVAGSMSTSDVNWRTGSSASVGTRIVTTDFVPRVFSTPVGVTGVADSYAEANVDSFTGTTTAGQILAQTFTGNGGFLRQCSFVLNKTLATVVGTITAKVYATTGTHGTDAIPTGAALAASSTDDMNLLPRTPAATKVFDFVGANRIPLVAGTVYAVGVELTTASSGGFQMGLDSTPAHAGNFAQWGGSSWSPFDSQDLVFSVSTASADLFAPTVTLGGGVGDQAVTGTTLAATSTITAPTVVQAAADQAVTTVALSAAATVTAPIVTPGAVIITGVSLASSAGIFAPTLTPSVLLATITSTATLFAPLVIPTQAITTATILATSGPLAPTLASALTAATRVSTVTLFAPSVVSTQVVTGATLAAGTVLFAPALGGLVRRRGFGYIMTTS